jgi:hypothetical protein
MITLLEQIILIWSRDRQRNLQSKFIEQICVSDVSRHCTDGRARPPNKLKKLIQCGKSGKLINGSATDRSKVPDVNEKKETLRLIMTKDLGREVSGNGNEKPQRSAKKLKTIFIFHERRLKHTTF